MRNPAIIEAARIKHAYSGAPGVPARMLSRMVPMEPRREHLEPGEQADIDAGQGQWMPKIIQHDDTPISQLMASPAKAGLLSALLGALGGGALGGGIGHLAGKLTGTDHTAEGAAIGAGAGAGLMGVKKIHDQGRDNAHTEEIIRRLPPGATKHDFMNSEMLLEALKNRYA